MTYCVNVWSSTYRTNLKMLCTAQKRSVRALSATAQQPHSRDNFLNQKYFTLNKFINQQEGILANKVINGTYLLGDSLNDRHELDHYQLRNCENLRIPLHSTAHSQLFIRYRAIKTWNSLQLLLLKEVGSARLRDSGMHPISPKTPAPQYQPIDRKKRKGKIVEDYSRIEQLRSIKKHWPCS